MPFEILSSQIINDLVTVLIELHKIDYSLLTPFGNYPWPHQCLLKNNTTD